MADKESVSNVPIVADDQADDRVEYVFDQEAVEAQKCAAKQDWKGLKEIFEKKGEKQKFLEPFDLFGNTIIHAVASSDNTTLLRELMDKLDEPNQRKALNKQNQEGNTLLHEAIFSKDVEMVKAIMEFGGKLHIGTDLLLKLNYWNETPVFRAAKHGKLKILKLIHATGYSLEPKYFLPNEIDGVHRTIFHYCLLTFNFDVAIWLMNKVDESLTSYQYLIKNASTGKIEQGFECLELLSKMPMAFRSTGTRAMGMKKKLVYYLLPDECYESELEMDDAGKNPSKSTRDIESGQADDEIEKPSKSICLSLDLYYSVWKHVAKACSSLYYSVWKHVAKAFNCIKEIWELKKQHKLAEHVAKRLNVSSRSSYKYSYERFIETPRLISDFPSNVKAKKNKIDKLKNRVIEEEKIKKIEPKPKEDQANEDNKSERTLWESSTTPLFLAAAAGIIEVVTIIVDDCPAAIFHVDSDGHNILHMAIRHRQLEIYEFLEERSAIKALAPRICSKSNGRTILHQAASMEYYREQALPGVAYQLQDELEWYERVRSIVPGHYLMHCDNEGLTAGDLLDIEHSEMHDQAKQWMKETAQSCSTVAVLIAGVVFAAAYAVPGGNEGGQAVLRNSSAFRFFTVMDVVALASSLGSVVMFLSILTSSFDLWEFHKSLPRKLKVGFIMLFCALIATMLAFAATILLTIRMEGNKRTTTFIYSLAFVIVSIFGLTQFPIYKMVEEDMFKQCSKYWKKKKRCCK